MHASGLDFRLFDGSDLKTSLLMRWKGPDAIAVCRDLKTSLLMRWKGPDALTVCPAHQGLLDFYCSSIQFYLLLSPYLCFISLLYLELYVLGYGALIS